MTGAVSDLNIYQRMAAITSALPAVPKSMEIGEGRYAYKAVREADILSTVKPVEKKNGVYSFPFSRTILDDGDVTIQTKTGDRTQHWVRMQTVYRFVNTDNPDEYIDVTSFADGIDQADKALGKAMTYCDKYALLKAYKITTGDDSDQGTAKNEIPEPERCSPPPVCELCGSAIAGTKGRNGKWWSPEELADYSVKKYGRTLCSACAKSLAGEQN